MCFKYWPSASSAPTYDSILEGKTNISPGYGTVKSILNFSHFSPSQKKIQFVAQLVYQVKIHSERRNKVEAHWGRYLQVRKKLGCGTACLYSKVF